MKVHSIISAALSLAVRYEWIDRNPAERATLPRVPRRDPEGRAELRERVQVEHALAHVGYWRGRRARYRGIRKNLFDLRRVAVVHNLHIIARQLDDSSYQLAA